MGIPAGYTLGKNGYLYRLSDNSGPYLLNADGSISQGLAKKLFTDDDGPNARLRVDLAQTSFFDGREFRTFKELNIATGATYVIKAVVPVNTVLFGLELDLDQGSCRLGTYQGGSEGGVFSEVLPIIPRNKMTDAPVVAPQVTLTAGGTHTGGTELDVIRLVSSTALLAARSSVGAVPGDERGVGPGTYYFRLLNFSGVLVTNGTLKARWEERP